ncbi:hypothetical protein Sinac_1704 [Singulisphaera acidiphila DSM 18658]|uniref:Uncharacterized protein n=1 Tax=Singulisphaera acidiphila (strain ATCC BAA-1392 / DSM 18658 / VKM B-2454 / MOB10) TaxID=886293 RepID=L0DB43_SINAD|nr:hypothetical protein Sinac_1704 [Singulisphaera acidiphila DSM 18658]
MEVMRFDLSRRENCTRTRTFVDPPYPWPGSEAPLSWIIHVGVANKVIGSTPEKARGDARGLELRGIGGSVSVGSESTKV